MKAPWLFLALAVLQLCALQIEAFAVVRDNPLSLAAKRAVHLYAQTPSQENGSSNKEEEKEEELSEADARLSDILPPTVSFSRNSILFSENPVTQRNNEVLTVWRGMKKFVPPFITGAWPWRDPYLGEANPLDAFYNILFVRLPIVAMGFIYAKNLKEGHPLIMDYGDGPFEVSPIIVFAVLAIVLA